MPFDAPSQDLPPLATPEDVEAALGAAKAYTDEVFGHVAGPDVAAEAAQDAKITDLEDRLDALENTPPSGPGPAYVGLPYTVISHPTDIEVQKGIKAWVDNRSGNQLKSHLLFNWTGRAALTTPLFKYMADNPAIPQLQGARIQGLAKRATELGWSNSGVPLLTSNGELRNFEFKDLTFTSTAPLVNPAQGLLFNSNEGVATGSDGKFDSVEFMGPWDYGLALDGGPRANLNSEMVFDQFACGNTFSSVRGLFVCGLSGDDPQEDQFLNFSFRDCKLEGSHGPYLVFNKGGSVTIEGYQSWIHTGSQNGGVPEGIMLKMAVTTHFDSVQTLVASHIRAEIRGPKSKFMDCGWTGSGRVVLVGPDTGANTFKDGMENVEDITLRNGVHLNLISPALGGYIALRDKGGVVRVDDVKLVYGRNVASYSPDGAGNSLVRNFTGVTQPAPLFR